MMEIAAFLFIYALVMWLIFEGFVYYSDMKRKKQLEKVLEAREKREKARYDSFLNGE